MTGQGQTLTDQEFLMPGRKPSAEGVARAAARIAAILPPTPLLPLDVDGVTIWCKAECDQPVGAFKIRGGIHRIADLSDQQAARGVVAFSSGNHAQGVSWAAKERGISATIVMPSDAPSAKVEGTRKLGAAIIFYERLTESREDIADRIAAETGATVIPSFADPWIIEGQGSCGAEIREQMIVATGSPPDQLVICCGGGGLSSGSALANPDAEIVIVEPEGWDDMGQSLRHGVIEPVGPNPPATACDALQTLRVSSLTFDILHARGATGIAVREAEVAHAMRVAKEQLGRIVEPGGAVALAALLSGKVTPTVRTALTLSGGNVDPATFARLTERAAS